MKYKVSDDIKKFYDDATVYKLRDFIYGNARVDKAWTTIKQHVPNPKNILEIGCGVGSMCHRCNNQWPDANIVGIDISEKSVEIANAMFQTEKCNYYTSLPNEFDKRNKFDLIMLIDVIEHVEKNQRPELISFIKNNLSEEGILLLAFPTPHILNINRKFFPELLQPVEEDIFMSDLQEISKTINKPLVLYKEVFVWEKRDYAHAIFADKLIDNPQSTPPFHEILKAKLKSRIKKNNVLLAIKERKKLVFDKLNIDIPNL